MIGDNKEKQESDDRDLGEMMMNIVKNTSLIAVLRWKDFHSTLIEISLPIILYLFYT